MRNFGNHGLQVSTESPNNSSSGVSNESLSVESSSNANQAANLNSNSNSRKRAHSGQSKLHNMAPNDSAGKRKDVSGITRPDLQRSVPTFLSKLYNMVNDPASTDLIRWSTDGTSFIVERHEEFAAKVLPRFFKHNTFASFVRQLNMYDFHKVPHIMQGVLVSENEGEVWEFSNSNFQRDQPDLLLLVSRKRTRDRDDKEAGATELSQLINDIASIKRHQTTISTDLRNLQRDNLILWQDNLAAREKHERHHDMIQKILRFLASVFSNNQIEMLIGILAINQDAININLPALIQSAKGVNENSKSSTSASAQAPLTAASVVAAALGSTPYGPPTVPPTTRTQSESSYSTPHGSSGNLSPVVASKELGSTPDINISQQSSDLAAVAKSAESINEDIDSLQDHIESLASQLGFDPVNFGEDIENADIAIFMNQHDNMITGASYNDRMNLFDMIDRPYAKDLRSEARLTQGIPGPSNVRLKPEDAAAYPTPNGKYNPRPWTPNTTDPQQKKSNPLTNLLDELSGLYQVMGGVLSPPVSIPGSSQYSWPPSMPPTAAPSHSMAPVSGVPTVSETFLVPTPVIASPFVPPHHPGMSPIMQAQAGRPGAPMQPGMYENTPSAVMPGVTPPPGYPAYPYMGQPMYPGMAYYHMPPTMSQPPAVPTARVSTPSSDDSEPSSKRVRTDSPVSGSAASVSGTPPHPTLPIGVAPYHPAYAHMAPHMMYGQMPTSGPVYPFYASAFPPGYGYPSHPPHMPPIADYPGMTTPIPVTSPEPPTTSASTSKLNAPGSEAAE